MKILALPVCGKSSRYSTTRPKWMLTHPNGSLMLTESIKGLDVSQFDLVVVILLKEHEDKYEITDKLQKEFVKKLGLNPNKIHTIQIDGSDNQPETIRKGLARLLETNIISSEDSVFIKDCDNYFELDKEKLKGNCVIVHNLHNVEGINIRNKSYIKIGEYNNIVNIMEKRIISDIFCCGGYYFESIGDYNKYFDELKDEKDLYISHIIYKMILDKKMFFSVESSNYLDWGTIEDWRKYTSQFKTIFIDLDGVLVINSSGHFKPIWGETDKIDKNVNYLNKLYDSGKYFIIITTSRSESCSEKTFEQLKRLGIKWHKILFDLPHAQRIIVNDYAGSNPYPSAVAVNLLRNTDNLQDFI